MTNYEKFFDEILESAYETLGVDKIDNSIKSCHRLKCSDCLFGRNNGSICYSDPQSLKEFCKKKYVEQKIDSRINQYTPIDTKLLVSIDGKTWNKRHFAGYVERDGVKRVKCFVNGATSFSNSSSDLVDWCYARLYEE